MTNFIVLIKASRAGHFDMVKLLINNGANVNVRNKYGSSPLSFGKQMN